MSVTDGGAIEVRINDLAAPPEPMGVLLFMEPFAALKETMASVGEFGSSMLFGLKQVGLEMQLEPA